MPNNPNEWKRIKRDATWPDVVDQFRQTDASRFSKLALRGAVSVGLEEPNETISRVARYVHARGLSIIDAAEAVYNLRGSPKGRLGLSDVSSDRAIRLTRKMAVELALAFYDATEGRVFQASHRIARARALLERHGERAFHELVASSKS